MSEKRQEKDENSDIFLGKTIFNKYKMINKIGEGSFGFIYAAQSINSNKLYAIKLESMIEDQYLLEDEALILSYLNCNRIPKIKLFGYSGNYMVLIMELLGKSLDKIINELPKKKMSLRCTCNIAYQLISIFEIIHNNNIIHRDIKPSNIAMGLGSNYKYLYILDFGLSRKYRSKTTKKHIEFTKDNPLVGNARYSSINALEGGTISRRDDLESIGYLIIYLILGKLPWQGIIGNNREDKFYKILSVKKNTTPEELCKGLPPQFVQYIKYTRNLEFEADPDYNYLKNLFLSVLKSENHEFDYYYDWDPSTFPGSGINTISNNLYNYNNYLKTPKLFTKILEIEKERKEYGGNFEFEKYVFDIEEESNYNIVKRKRKNELESDLEIYGYSNSMTPYAHPKNQKKKLKIKLVCHVSQKLIRMKKIVVSYGKKFG